jgi:hypothetical protein
MKGRRGEGGIGDKENLKTAYRRPFYRREKAIIDK